MDIDWVLWAGTIGFEKPVKVRAEAARAAGFRRVSLSPVEVAESDRQGTEPQELGRFLRDTGLEVVVDPVMNWCGPPLSGSSFAAIGVDEILRMCAAVGAVSLGAIGQPAGEVGIEEVTRSFGTLCDRAGEIGVLVHLEFMPMLSIHDLAAAWTVVSGADRPNGGLLVDTWHFFRGNPDLALLEQVPGERVFGVQVADGAADVTTSLDQDTFNRLMPGDGSFDLVTLLGTLDRIGGLRCVGPEVISPTTAAMPPAEAAATARDRTAELIGRARSASLDQPGA